MMLSLSNRALTLALLGTFFCFAGPAGCGKTSDSKSADKEAPAGGEPTDTAPDPANPHGYKGVGVPAAEAPALAPVPPLKTVLMSVDGVEITQAGFERVLNVYLRGQASTMPAAQVAAARAQLHEQIEERLIMDVLLDKAVVAEVTTATDEQVAEEWKKVEANVPPGTTLEESLAQQGYDRVKAEKEIRQFLGHKNLHEKVAGEAPISDEEARAYYDQNLLSFQTQESVNARHILLMTKGATAEEKVAKEKKIAEIRESLVAGKADDFAAVAGQVSDCPSKAQGGSLGDLSRGATVAPFEKMAFSLPVGEISPVVETEFGYHLIKVEKKTEAGTKPYEEVSAGIKQRLATNAQRERVAAYHKKLRAAATVVRSEAATKTGSDTKGAPGK